MILSESVDRWVAEWEEKQRSSMARMLARQLHERFGGLAEGVRTRLHSASRDWGARVEVGCGWTKGGRGEQRATLVQASDIAEPTAAADTDRSVRRDFHRDESPETCACSGG